MADGQHYDKIYIDGAWVASDGDGTIDVINASTEQVMGSVPEGTAADVDRAVAAAATAFETWGFLDAAERQRYIARIAEELAARSTEIAETISGEVGMPIMWSNMIQAGLPTGTFARAAELIDEFELEKQIGNSLVVKEPIGVVACITPWNYPLHQIAAKVAPALAVGCTIVLKPSVEAPLNAFLLAEIIDAVGLPPGVFNLVSGRGRVLGEAMATHPDVDMISLTGSTGAGRRVSELAAGTIKRTSMELGGKSANVILDDANFAEVVPKGVFGCYLNSGQTCSAHTRMIVPRAHHDEICEIARATAEAMPLGPASGSATLGPLISDSQRATVRGYIEKGIEEGATLVCGGAEAPDGDDLATGYFVQPTIFGNVTSDMTIAQEEIFGPVLSILPYDTEEEAIRIANDSIYGLAGGVWSGDLDRATRVARRMRTGQVDVNGGAFNPHAPFGGYKQSGNGRELGEFGFDEFLEVKSLQLP